MANRNIERAVRVALLAAGAVSVGAYSSGAAAQTGDEVEQIIVTGSRIPQPNIEGASPVTTIGAQDVQLEGVTDTANLVNNLPQAFAAQGGNLSNGSSGTSTLNLRNLGDVRTLVLVNGRRLPAGDPNSVAPDVNQIPAPLVERVEVLTGGAGAVYGSDAVAGVVNFIMKDDFEGIELDGQYSWYNHNNDDGQMNQRLALRDFSKPGNYVNDGDTYDLSILMGSNFADGKGNATLFIGYRQSDPVNQGSRDYSACALQTNASGATTGAYVNGARCGGSGTNATGSFYAANNGFDGPYGVDPDFTNEDGLGIPGASPLYNYAPLNYYQRPDKRWTADAFLHYDVTDNATVYGEFMFMDDHTLAQIAPSGIFSTYYDLPCDGANPLVSQEWRDTLCFDSDGNPTATGTAPVFIQRRNVEGGPRQDDLRHTDYRGVVGVRGKVFDHWNYDVYGTYGQVLLNEHVNNYVSNSRGLYALDVISDPRADSPTFGQPVCAGAVAGYAPNCVPWNIWSPGGVTDAALGYINTQGFSSGHTDQTVVNGTMSADLGDYGWTSPWATSGIGVAFGIEYRQEGLSVDYDYEYTTGDLGGGGGIQLPVSGSYNLMDYFAEARVPIVEDAVFAKSLVLNASYRYSDYSTGINTSTYGIGLDWAPMDDFKLRGSFDHAVRAPNVVELYSQQAVGLFDWGGDPCAGDVPDATLAECQLTGMTPAQYGNTPLSPAQQYNQLAGGNPDLNPETADTWTAGIVLTPTFLDGFTMTIDYFNIKITDVINNIQAPTTVSQCIATADPFFCDNIHRNDSGSLWLTRDGYVNAITTNLGSYKTTGTDFNVNYNLAMGDWGSLNFNELATWLDSFVVEEIPGYGKYDCKGYYGATCGTPLPEWKSKFRTTWSTPWNVDLAVTWRYVASVENDAFNSDIGGALKPFDKTLDSQNYWDLAGTFSFAEHYTLNAGINNILDESPPLSSQVGTGYGNGNTYPQVYDALGRYIFVGLTAKF